MDYRTPEELHEWLRRQGLLQSPFAAGPGGRPLMSPPPFGPGLPLGGVPMELPSRVPPPPPFGPVPIVPTVRTPPVPPPPPPERGLFGKIKDKLDVALGVMGLVQNPVASFVGAEWAPAPTSAGKVAGAIDMPAQAVQGMLSAATYIPGVMGQEPPKRFLTPGEAIRFQQTLPASERFAGEMLFDPTNVVPVSKAGDIAQLFRRGQAAAPPPGITRSWEFLPSQGRAAPPPPPPSVPPPPPQQLPMGMQLPLNMGGAPPITGAPPPGVIPPSVGPFGVRGIFGPAPQPPIRTRPAEVVQGEMPLETQEPLFPGQPGLTGVRQGPPLTGPLSGAPGPQPPLAGPGPVSAVPTGYRPGAMASMFPPAGSPVGAAPSVAAAVSPGQYSIEDYAIGSVVVDNSTGKAIYKFNTRREAEDFIRGRTGQAQVTPAATPTSPVPGATPQAAWNRNPHTKAVSDAVSLTPESAYAVVGNTRVKTAASGYGSFGRVIGDELYLADGSTLNANLVDRVEDAAGNVLYSRAATPTPTTPSGTAAPTAAGGAAPAQPAVGPTTTVPPVAQAAAGAAPVPGAAPAPTVEPFYKRMPWDSYWEDARRVLYEKQVGGAKLLQKAVGLFEPARAIQDPVQEVGITKALFESRETSRIRSLVNAEYATNRPIFGFKGNKALAVSMKSGLDPSLVDHPASRTLPDMVEHRELYNFTPEQAAAVDRWEATFDESLREVNASGVPWDEIGEAYYPHIIKKKPGDKALDALINPPGYAPGRARKFKDIRSLIDEGFEVDLNPRTSTVTRLEAGMRAVSRREALNRLKEFPEVRVPGSGESPRFGEQEVLGRFAPKEFVEKVDKWVDLPGLLGQKARRGDSAGMQALSLARSLKTTFDNGVLFTQGQVLFFRDPIAWTKMAGKSFSAMVSDPADYWKRNIDIIDEGHKNGAISRPAEFLVSEEGLGALVEKVPVLGSTVKRFNRAFETGIIVGQTEFYKGIRQGVQNEDDLISMSSAVSKILGTEDYAKLGVGRTQQNVEQLAFFASRFMRANVGLMAQAFTPGPGGDQARKALGSLITGATALTFGLQGAFNQDLPSTDPDSPTWMKVKVGDSYINMYGPFYTYFRQIARMGKHGAEGEIDEVTKDFINLWKPKLSTPFQAAEITAHLAVEGEKQHYGETIDVTPGGIGTMAKELFAPISTAETVEGLVEGRPEALFTPVIPSMAGPTPSTEKEEFRNILGLSYEEMEKEDELASLIGYMGDGEKPDIEWDALRAARADRIKDAWEMGTRQEGGGGEGFPSWTGLGGGGDNAGFKFRNDYYAMKNRWIGATNNIFREEEDEETREEYLARPPRQKNFQPVPVPLLHKLAIYNPKEYYRIVESWQDTRNFIASKEHIPVEERVKMINYLMNQRFPQSPE